MSGGWLGHQGVVEAAQVNPPGTVITLGPEQRVWLSWSTIDNKTYGKHHSLNDYLPLTIPGNSSVGVRTSANSGFDNLYKYPDAPLPIKSHIQIYDENNRLVHSATQDASIAAVTPMYKRDVTPIGNAVWKGAEYIGWNYFYQVDYQPKITVLSNEKIVLETQKCSAGSGTRKRTSFVEVYQKVDRRMGFSDAYTLSIYGYNYYENPAKYDKWNYKATLYGEGNTAWDESECNTAPSIPAGGSMSINEDTSGVHIVAITDPDSGDKHTVQATTQPKNGTLSISGNKVTYTPRKDWNGTDTFKIQAKDSAGALSGVQTVTVTVKPMNDAPSIPANATLVMDEDTTGTHTVVITDPDLGMPSDSHTIEIAQQPVNGTVSSAKSGNNFVLSYKPKKDWNGTDTLKVRVKDAAGVYSGEQTLTITVKPVNDAPVIPASAALTIDEDTTGTHTVVITDVDFGMPGDEHSLVVDGPKNGTLTHAKSGNNIVLTYKPNKDWNGTEVIKVQVKDQAGALSGEQILTVTVRPVNDAPSIPASAQYTIEEDTSGSHTVVITDVDFDMPHDSHTLDVVQVPANGTIESQADGRDIVLTYTPNPDWNGTETIVVRVKDEGGAFSNEQTITFVVTPVNDEPVLDARQELEVDEDTELRFSVTVQDVDFGAPGDSHRLEFGGMENSTVKILSGGEKDNPVHELSFMPNKDWNGTERFWVKVFDEAGEGSLFQDVIVVVKPVNDAPTAVNVLGGTIHTDQYSASEWHDIEVADVDLPDQDEHTFEVSGDLQGGRVEFNGYQLRYIADGNFHGELNLTITATDAGGETVSNTFTVVVRETKLEGTIRLPSVKGVFTGRSNRMPVVTPAYGKKLDEYRIKVLASSERGIQLEGDIIGVGEVQVFNDGLYQTKGNVLELPIGSTTTGGEGEATLAIFPADPNEPALAYKIEFYPIETEITAKTFEVISLLEKLDLKVKHKGDSAGSCRITLVESTAKTHDALNDPVCFLEWVDLPDEAVLATWRDEQGTLLPAVRGKAYQVGPQKVSYDLSMFTGSGQRVLIEHVSEEIDVTSAYGQVGFKPAQDKPEVMRSVELYSLLLRQDKGPTCQPTTDRDLAISQAQNDRLYCLITWVDTPVTLADPLQDNLPRLEGYLDDLGKNRIEWQIFTFSRNGEEVDLGNQDISIDVVVPSLPTIEVSSKYKFGENYVVPMGDPSLGTATFTSEPADLFVGMARDDEELVGEVFYTGNVREKNRVSRIIEVEHDRGLYGEQQIVLKAAYDMLPEAATEERIKVITAPAMEVEPLLSLTDNVALDNVVMPVTVNMVNRRYYDRDYRPEYGLWEVGIYQKLTSKDAGESLKLVSELKQTGTTGQVDFELDLTQVEGTSARLVAVARLVHNIPEYERTAESRATFVSILYGGEVDGDVVSRKFSGESVYNARFQFVPNKEDMRVVRAMGQTQWHVSSDGGQTWETSEPTPGRSLTRKFGKGIYHLKAVSFNKHSGVEFTSAEVELIVYDKPTLKLEGATRLMVGDTTHLKLTPFIHGEERPVEDFVFEWSTDKGQTWEQGTHERTVTSDAIGTYQLRARVREVEAPGDDRGAWEELRINPRFYPVRGPKVGLRVPRKMEVGKDYVLTATARTRVAQMQGEIVGEFIMPDGTRHRGTELTYMPTKDDELVGRVPVTYEAWFEGFKDEGGITTRSTNARIWEYVWPAFEIKTVGTIRFAPTRINMGLSQSVPTILESPVYEWKLPEGAEVIRQTGSRIEFIVKQGGEYDVEVDISDARGNETTVAMKLPLEDAPAWEVEREVSYSNETMRAPLIVSYRPSFSGGHPLDRVAKKRFYLNGELFKESGFTAKSELPAGTHTLSVEMESRYGQLVVDEFQVTVSENQPPVCSVEVADLETKWRVVPECEDEDGAVRRLNWSVNGVESSGAKYKTFIKSRIREDLTVLVSAVDDSGDSSEPQRVVLRPEPGRNPGDDGPVEEHDPEESAPEED